MSIVIHIGLRKTGTTFLQRSLYRCRDELASRGVTYPDPTAALGVDGPKGHHFIPHAIIGRRRYFTPDADFSLLDEHARALRQEMAASRGNVGVISSEIFTTFETPDHVARVRQLFPDPETRILVYLRRQDEWIDSMHGQTLKSGKQHAVENTLRDEKAGLDYLNLIETWAEAFGRENIIVRTYEKAEPLWLWRDFMDALGRPDAAEIVPPTEQENISLPYELSTFAKSLKNYGQDRRMRRILETMAVDYPDRIGLKYLSQEQGIELMKEFKDSNDQIAREYCGRDSLFENMDVLPHIGADSLDAAQYAEILGGISLKLIARIRELEKEVRDLKTAVRLSPTGLIRKVISRKP